MSVSHILFSFCIIILACSSNAQSYPEPTRTYNFSSVLEGEKYFKVYWNYDATTLKAAIVCESFGWCGLGWSADGDMVKSDAVIGRIESNLTVGSYDYYLRSQYPPGLGTCPNAVCEDVSNDDRDCFSDVTMISGSKIGAYIVFEFDRPLIAADSCDMNVLTTPYIIYAVGNNTVPPLEYSLKLHDYSYTTAFNWSIPFNDTSSLTGKTNYTFTTSSGGIGSSSSEISSTESTSDSSSMTSRSTVTLVSTQSSSSSSSSESSNAIVSSSNEKGMAIWLIAVIAVAGFLLIALILFLIIYFSVRAHRRSKHEGNFY